MVSRTPPPDNPVGCNRALDEVLCAALFLFVLENSNEEFSDHLSLLLRFSDALEGLKIDQPLSR